MITRSISEIQRIAPSEAKEPMGQGLPTVAGIHYCIAADPYPFRESSVIRATKGKPPVDFRQGGNHLDSTTHSVGSLFAEQQIDDPAAAHVFAAFAAMGQDVGVVAAGVFQRVGQHGQVGEAAFLVDRAS